MGSKRVPIPNKYIALDVETANTSPATICQIGLAWFEDGVITDTWSTYLNPNCDFSPINVRIHGIRPETVESSPCFCDIVDDLRNKFHQAIVVHHTHFDHTAFTHALEKHKLPDFDCTWLDSSVVARRTWEKYAIRGFGIADICQDFGIDLGNHHDALSDAIACGKILSKAILDSGTTLDKWVKKVGFTPAMVRRKRENALINAKYKNIENITFKDDNNDDDNIDDVYNSDDNIDNYSPKNVFENELSKTTWVPKIAQPTIQPNTATYSSPQTKTTDQKPNKRRIYKIGIWRAIIGLFFILISIVPFSMISSDSTMIIMAFIFLIPAGILLLPWERWIFDQIKKMFARKHF